MTPIEFENEVERITTELDELTKAFDLLYDQAQADADECRKVTTDLDQAQFDLSLAEAEIFRLEQELNDAEGNL